MIDVNNGGKKARSEQKRGFKRQLLEYEPFAFKVKDLNALLDLGEKWN